MTRKMKDSGVEWIGMIPDGWNVVPAKLAFDEVQDVNKDGAVQKALKFKFGSIIPKTNFDSDDEYVAGTITNYTIVNDGDIIVNGLNLNYDLKSLRVGLVREKGVITSAYLALRPRTQQISSVFATYLLKGYETRMALHNMGYGIRKTLGFKEFKTQPILLPSLAEQNRIAGQLDAKCASIDGVIAKTNESIEEYKKLKQAVITEAVTKGVRGKRPMKDSGVDWIGQIPKEWDVVPLKYLCRMQSGKTLSSEQIASEGAYPVYGGNGLRGFFTEYNTEGQYLLVGRQGALCGNVHRVHGQFWATEHALITECTHFSIMDFLFYLLIGMNLNQYASNSAAQPGLAAGAILNVKTSIVPLDEQREIADYLDSKCAAIDTLISKKQQFIDELTAYKKSLIYEYVTGKKEVPA